MTLNTSTLLVEGTMREIVSTMTSKGQVTIPIEIRRHLGLATRDKIAFVVHHEGTVRLAAPHYPDLESLRGAAGSLDQPRSWEEIEEIAREERLQERYGRSRST